MPEHLPAPSHFSVAIVAAVSFGLLGTTAGLVPPVVATEFWLLLVAAAAAPILAQPVREWPALRLPFVIEFLALLTAGPAPMLLVAACGLASREFLLGTRLDTPWQRAVRPLMVLVALSVAAWIHASTADLANGQGSLLWALPAAAAAVAYCVVISLLADLLAPGLAAGRLASLRRAWPDRFLRGCPVYLVAAAAAAGLAELIAAGAWQGMLVALVPLFLAHRVYGGLLDGIDEGRERLTLLDALHDGTCVVGRDGRVVAWSAGLETTLSCPRDRALGRPLTVAVAELRGSALARAVEDVGRTRKGSTVPRVTISTPAGPRMLRVSLNAAAAGVALVWRDVTEEARSADLLRRQAERLALAAEGANDGLWEWDVRSQQFYVTARWRAMLGLSPEAGVARVEEWLDRVHPDDLGPVKAALEAHFSGETDHFEHDHRLRHEDGSYRSFRCRGRAAAVPGGRPWRVAGSLTDTTDLAMTQEQLRNAVFLDPLTGLCNRALFVEQLGRRLTELKRRPSGAPFALLYLDLDRFKVVNDSLGHLVGDELLVAASRRLESCLRQGDILSRLGGDEFAILLNGLQNEQQANIIAFRVQDALARPFSIGGREVFTSASIGIAFGAPQYNTPDEMMHDADTAMYHAKGNGKARHEVFDADMDARARDRLGLENDLRHAVASDQIELHYQPIVALATGMCIGFETLVRWTRNGKPVSPAVFVPMAEELGLIERLGTRVLEEACRTFAGWQRSLPSAGLECITVNVSSRQLMQHNFLSVVDHAVRSAGLERSALRIEITETALMTSPEAAASVLKQLRDYGVKIYLDDFGTGYSSLSHLHNLPVDALKIDRSFVQSLFMPHRPAIVESIMALAHTLHTSVVAEGIETEAQARELERLGCHNAQGFLFSKAVSAAAAEAILVQGRPLGPVSSGIERQAS